jgi:hypothetical protein
MSLESKLTKGQFTIAALLCLTTVLGAEWSINYAYNKVYDYLTSNQSTETLNNTNNSLSYIER